MVVRAGDSQLRAFDVSAGAVKWTTALDEQADTNSPVIAKRVVYVADGFGTVYGIDAANGDTLWPAYTDGGFEVQPVVANGYVYFGDQDNNLYAFALDGGFNAKYRRKQTPPSYASLRPDMGLKAR